MNNQREQNRKILEELQAKKQTLLKQTQVNSFPSFNQNFTVNMPSIPGIPTDNYNISPVQRAALHTAQTLSCGYFITQDSSHGNSILPVLPRFDK